MCVGAIVTYVSLYVSMTVEREIEVKSVDELRHMCVGNAIPASPWKPEMGDNDIMHATNTLFGAYYHPRYRDGHGAKSG